MRDYWEDLFDYYLNTSCDTLVCFNCPKFWICMMFQADYPADTIALFDDYIQ